MKTSCCLAALTLATAAALWAPSARAVNYTYSGSLDSTDPVFNRPVSTTSLSAVGTAVFYDVQPFFLTLSSSVTMTVNSFASSDGDSFFALYQTAFNASSPLTNLIAVNDDAGAGTFLSAITANLTAATSYFLVTTTYNNGITGAYNDTIAPANALAVVTPTAVPEPSTWALALGGLGVLILLQRRRTRLLA